MEQLEQLPQAGHITVIAKSAEEMAHAQVGLIGWVTARIVALRSEVAEAETNLQIAQKSKWRQTPWKRAVKRALGRVTYYEKMKAALEAGYVIMPDLPGSAIAVRTTMNHPMRSKIKSTWSNRSLPNATASEAPVGAGQYVAPDMTFEEWEEEHMSGDRKITDYYAKPTDFNEVDFPMVMVKPQIIDETNRAMAARIFDEIVVLPASSASQRMLPGSDPIVLGRIVRTEGTRRLSCAFLIMWWLDTSTL